jgi:hypothetical protein
MEKMKNSTIKTFLSIALFAITLNAQSGPISLDPIGNASSADIFKNGNALHVHGACGGAVVKVLGIKQETFGPDKDVFGFNGDDADGVFVVGGPEKPTVKLSYSDYNTVLCVPVGERVGKQFRLIVGSVCTGSACGDAMNFEVFDPKLWKKVSPTFCDITCASKLVRSNVLKQIGLN